MFWPVAGLLIIVGKSSTLCKQSNDPECMTSSPFFTRKDWKNHQGGAAEPPSVRSRRSRLHVISPVRCFISHGDGGWIHLGSFRFFWCGISWKQLEVQKVDESLLFWLVLQVGWFFACRLNIWLGNIPILSLQQLPGRMECHMNQVFLGQEWPQIELSRSSSSYIVGAATGTIKHASAKSQ